MKQQTMHKDNNDKIQGGYSLFGVCFHPPGPTWAQESQDQGGIPSPRLKSSSFLPLHTTRRQGKLDLKRAKLGQDLPWQGFRGDKITKKQKWSQETMSVVGYSVTQATKHNNQSQKGEA